MNYRELIKAGVPFQPQRRRFGGSGMKRIVAGCALAACVFAAWAIPALGGAASPSNKRLERRLDSLTTRLNQASSSVAALKTQVATLANRPAPSLHVQQVQGSFALAAPGVMPLWYVARASCPVGTSLTGGGINFNGVYGNMPVVESSGPVGNDWVATIRYQGSPNPPSLGVYALCATVS